MSLRNPSRGALWTIFLLLEFIPILAGKQEDDVILGGIFSEHFTRENNGGKDRNNDPCGELNKRATTDRLAMEFAVSEINDSGDILPGIRLGTNMKDTCNDLDYAVNNTLDYQFIKTKFINKSYQCSAQETDSKCCIHRNESTPLVGIIAGAYSHIVKAIVNLVGLFKVPVIGYSSTSPSLNKMDYFLRTIPPDTVTTQVMVDLIRKLRWNIVLVVYVDNEFGHYAADGFRTAIRRMGDFKICIAFDDKFSKDSQSDIARVLEGYPRTCFERYLQRRTDVNTTCSNVHRNMKYECELMYGRLALLEPNCSIECSKYIPHVLDAVYAIAMSLHNMLGCEAGKSCREKLKTLSHSSLLDSLKNLSFFSDFTNHTISFDGNGNPLSTHYTVEQIEVGNCNHKNKTIGRWTCLRNVTCNGELSPNIIDIVNPASFGSSCGPKCNNGWYKSAQDEYPDCCWTCKKCTGNKYMKASDQFSCSECPVDRWPNENRTSCAEMEHDYLDILSASGVLILAWNCLGLALVLLIGGIFLKYSTSHIVKASSRQLSLLLLLGISLDFTLLIALLREPDATQCTAIFVLSHGASCLITGTLFLKTNRIHRIFRKSAMTGRPRWLGNACQLTIITILVTIEMMLAATILVFKPDNGDVRTTYVMEGDMKKAFLLCNFFGKTFQNDIFHVLIWSYECGMIFICTYQAYLVRKVPENYNEARYITFTMVTMSMNIVVYVITTSSMEGKNLVLVYCIFQSLKSSVALACIFLPKIYIILFQPEKNVPHNPVKSKLGTFVEENSMVKLEPNEIPSSGSSTRAGDSSEGSSGGTGTSSASARGRSYRKVGAKIVEETVDKVEISSDLNESRASEQDFPRSADVVIVNGLADSMTSC
ncbi:metabotropic glutamate receptor 3-like [Dendronephthya gigantea]|uniref:metabotropic glutamate receptor 3-like n=1 Tax=Dendronephthya gigantea TaxID=151771 RepID=UPI00106A60D1|nr:metabotropic glutamate receptor 3-like [Dendronephthya gigantea]